MDDRCECGLSRVHIPASAEVLPSLGTVAPIQELRGLKEATIPEGTERVGGYWFWGSGVERVIIPACVRELGTGAFCSCKALREVLFLGAISAPEEGALRTIGSEAFCVCSALRRVDLPEGLEEIGTYAFSQTGLEGVEIPRSVRKMHQGAFCKCEHLRRAILN